MRGDLLGTPLLLEQRLHHRTELLVLAEPVPPGPASPLSGPGMSEIAVVAAGVGCAAHHTSDADEEKQCP